MKITIFCQILYLSIHSGYVFPSPDSSNHLRKNMNHSIDSQKLRISDLLAHDMFYNPKLVTWHRPQLFFNSMTEYLGDFAMTGGEDGNMIKIAYYVPGTDHMGEKRRVGYAINLVAKPVYFGGYKYYFICPLCRRMCSVLYQPNHHEHFGCHLCHKIRYPTQICNQRHSGYTMLKRMMIEKKADDLEIGATKGMYKGQRTKRWLKIDELRREIEKYPSTFC